VAEEAQVPEATPGSPVGDGMTAFKAVTEARAMPKFCDRCGSDDLREPKDFTEFTVIGCRGCNYQHVRQHSKPLT
jgi:hypothetical protein